jgi:hypothetical protein
MIDDGKAKEDPKSYVRKQDTCGKNPAYCDDGLSFSIWEKFNYDSKVMTMFGAMEFPKKYIVSSGAEFDVVRATSCPGFAIYRQVYTS